MSKVAQHLYEFGPFRLETAERTLLRDGHPVSLPPKVFDTLLLLVQRRGHVVEKDELMQKLWPDTFVEESNLTQNVFTLRRVLGEAHDEHPYIETVPKRGYRFVADVQELLDEPADLIIEKHTRARVITEEEVDGSEDEKAAKAFEQKRLPAAGVRHKPAWLPRFLVLGVLLVGLALGLYYFQTSRETEKTAADAARPSAPRSIAVLPFKMIGAEGGNEYLGVGMADALITRLGNIGVVTVRPTSAVRKYTNHEQDPVAAGREQGVEAVLDGSVQHAGDRIRVTVQLVRVQGGVPLWAGTFDEKFTDIFSVQDSISEQVARALVPKLTGEEQERLTKRPTQNTEAYQLYLKGRYFWNKRTEEGYKRAIEYFEQALEKDPQYAQSYAGLADSHILVGVASGRPWKEMLRKAEAAAVKALEIDDTLAEAHTSLAMFKAISGQDDYSEKEFKRAIELNPSYSTAHHWYSLFLAGRGRFDEGVREIKRAQELDPLSLIINTDVAWVFYFARQYDRVIEHCRRTLEIDPNFVQAHFNLGLAYEQKGMYDEAIEELQKAVILSKTSPGNLGELGRTYAVSGNRGEAMKILAQLKELSKLRHVHPQSIAVVYIGLGEKDRAFEWLEKAYEERDGWVTSLNVDPRVDSLRADPRFADLLRRVGLER